MADVVLDDAVLPAAAPPLSVRLSSTAAPTAYRLSPTRSAVMPAHSEASVSSMSARSSGRPACGPADDDADRGVAVPEADLGAAVDREQVALDAARASPGCRARSPRSPRCTGCAGSRGRAGSSGCRRGRGCGSRRGCRARAWSCPGARRPASSSSVRPTSSPAVRMPASCSGVLPSQRSRLNRPMPRNPTGERPPPPHPPIHRHAEVRMTRSNFCVPRRTSAWSLSTGAGGLWRRGGRGGTVAGWTSGSRRWSAAQDGVLSSTDAARVGVTPVQLDGLVRCRSARPGATRRLRPARGSTRRRTRSSATACGPRPSCGRRPTLDAASHHAALLLAGVDTYDVDLGIVDLVLRRALPRGCAPALRTHPSSGLGVEVVDGWSRVLLAIALCQVAAASGVVAAVCLDGRRPARPPVHPRSSCGRRCCSLPEYHREAAERAIALTDPALRVGRRDADPPDAARPRLRGREPADAARRAPLRRAGRLPRGGPRGRRVRRAGQVRRAARAARRSPRRRPASRRIVDLGYEVVRLVWADLANPAEVARRIRPPLARAVRRRIGLGA